MARNVAKGISRKLATGATVVRCAIGEEIPRQRSVISTISIELVAPYGFPVRMACRRVLVDQSFHRIQLEVCGDTSLPELDSAALRSRICNGQLKLTVRSGDIARRGAGTCRRAPLRTEVAVAAQKRLGPSLTMDPRLPLDSRKGK